MILKIVHWRKSTNTVEETQRQKFTNGREEKLDKCFQRSKQELHINFSLVEERLKISNPFAHVQKVLI